MSSEPISITSIDIDYEESIVNTIYIKRIKDGIYDKFPIVKERVLQYIKNKAVDKMKNDLDIYNYTYKSLENTVLNETDKNKVDLFNFIKHMCLSYYLPNDPDNGKEDFIYEFLQERSFNRCLISRFYTKKDDHFYFEKKLGLKEYQDFYIYLHQQILCWSFEGLLPTCCIATEMALALPYIYEINQLGCLTNESSQTHYEKDINLLDIENIQFPYLSCIIENETLKEVLNKLKYLDLVISIGNPAYFLNVESKYYSKITFHMNTDKYKEYFYKNEDPFWTDLIEILKKHKK